MVHQDGEVGRGWGSYVVGWLYIYTFILYGASNYHLPSHKSIPICKSRQIRTSCIIIITLCGYEETSRNGPSINILLWSPPLVHNTRNDPWLKISRVVKFVVQFSHKLDNEKLLIMNSLRIHKTV